MWSIPTFPGPQLLPRAILFSAFLITCNKTAAFAHIKANYLKNEHSPHSITKTVCHCKTECQSNTSTSQLCRKTKKLTDGLYQQIHYRKVAWYSSLTATGTHMPYRITRCYLPPDNSDIPTFTPAKRSWYSIKRPRRDARLSSPSWLVTHRDGRPTRWQSPIQVVTWHDAR